MGIDFKNLDAIEAKLDSTLVYIDDALNFVNNAHATTEQVAQMLVDKAIDKVEEKIAEFLGKTREEIIDSLHKQYTSLIAMVSMVESLATPPTTPDQAVTWITNFINYMFPQSKVVTQPVEYLTKLAIKLESISSKLQTIATYKPNLEFLEFPQVTVRPFNIPIQSISISDITG